jgi:hypothetical protein
VPGDAFRWICKTRLDKFGLGQVEPYETIVTHGNALTYGGASAIWQRLIGTGINAFSTGANAHIGVGDGVTPAAETQTDLVGGNKFRKVATVTHTDGTAEANSVITFAATFITSEANFAWAEWGIFNAASSGRMLNRKTASYGTKTSDESWTLTITLGFGAA